MSGLKEILTRPLWREDIRARTARRLRHALTTPVMTLAGVIWGILAAPAASEVLGWAFGGALGFSVLAYLYVRLGPAAVQIGANLLGTSGWLAGLLWDWLVVGGVIYLLTSVLAMPTFPAVTSAIVIGGSYALFLAWFFDDGGSRALFGFLSGGWGRPRAPFSHVETLLVRGDHTAARVALDAFVREYPRDPRGWLAFGRLLHRELNDPNEALRTLRVGLGTARLTVEQKQHYLYEIVQVCESCEEPERAIPDLERFVEEHADSPLVEWARSRLQQVLVRPPRLRR
jgi:hypothetical protein